MPRNLKNLFRSELIRQRRNGRNFGGRNKMKKLKNGKYADYNHIFSDKSYQTHLGRSKKFASFCKKNKVKKFAQITPNFAQKYLIFERNQGLSASTIAEDALTINHLLIGSGNWHANQQIKKAKLPGMPKRSNKIAKQREKPLTSAEWRARYPHKYHQYQKQIDTIRAFGLRRRELTGTKTRNGYDGLGDHSIFYDVKGNLRAVVQGKGGKVRITTCRSDLKSEMEHLYHGKIRSANDMPRMNHLADDWKHGVKSNKPFYHSFSHSVPTHIFRADFAQNRLRELATHTYSGRRPYIYYRLVGADHGHNVYQRLTRYHNLSQQHTMGEYTAPYGAFYELADELGHNRLDVLSSYIGEGR